MVAIGTGIAPILSILYHMLENNINRKATLYFGARYLEDLSFIEEKSCNGEVGRVTDTIQKYMKDGENKEAYLCGSPRMIDSVVSLLQEKDIPEYLIFYDKFQ